MRNDTARAVAELTMLDRDLDAAADEVGQCRALAADALRKAEAASTAGDQAEAAKWERTARGVAGRLVAAEAEAARDLAALEGRRRELLGDLAGVAAAEQDLAPAHARLDRVAADVQGRVARAQAQAELDALEAPALEGPPPADERADAALEGIRRELGSSG